MNPLKILIVDDEDGMRLGASRALKKFRIELPEHNIEAGLEITQAADGKTAIELLDSREFDLALLDYKLPDITGLDILTHIRERKLDLLAVMMTAYASLSVAVSATKNGAFDFLAKPFTPEELRTVIRKAAGTLLTERRARELAAEQRRVRFQFIRVLAHELKAPLNAVENYMTNIKHRVGGDDLSAYDRTVDRSLIRLDGMRKLIMDLLDLTRIESGQKVRELGDVDLIECAKNSIEACAIEAEKRGIKINLSAPESLVMRGDRGELEIIFNNLVSNAVKYNRDQGTVTVEISSENHLARIRVSDTGIGMSQEEVNKLFGEFVRIKNAKTKNILGSGLGLSILKKLTQLYKGSVKVESKEDVGTTFRVDLKMNCEAQ